MAADVDVADAVMEEADAGDRQIQTFKGLAV